MIHCFLKIQNAISKVVPLSHNGSSTAQNNLTTIGVTNLLMSNLLQPNNQRCNIVSVSFLYLRSNFFNEIIQMKKGSKLSKAVNALTVVAVMVVVNK